MIAPAQGLAERRQELVARSAAQRSALIANAEPLLGQAAALDRIFASVRRHAVLSTLAVGAVALLGSRRLFDIAERLLTIYLLVRRR